MTARSEGDAVLDGIVSSLCSFRVKISLSPPPRIPDSSSILRHKRKLGPAVSESIGFLVVCQGSFYSLSLPLPSLLSTTVIAGPHGTYMLDSSCKTDICLHLTKRLKFGLILENCHKKYSAQVSLR